MMRRLFTSLGLLSCCAQRSVASYPTPGMSRGMDKTNRKKYNFLNNERMVEKEKGLRNRREIRRRDDVNWHRRVSYRETVNHAVVKYIRYFPENVKRYVFYKDVRERNGGTRFHGMRKAPGVTSRRILHWVENEILKPENREHLIELIKSTGETPPTEEEWARYTDKKTGEIMISLYFHKRVEGHLRSFCVRPPNKRDHWRDFNAFLMANRNNFDICLPMRTWSLRQGPIRDDELIERSSQKEVRDILGELERYQLPHALRAFEQLTPAEREVIVQKAEENREALHREYERERLFSAKVMCGVTALKEIRALTFPAITYYNEEYYKYVIRRGGSVDATLRQSKSDIPSWFTLSQEVKLKYYCFERTMMLHPVSGAHLYIRYATRDYGMQREEAYERWSALSDLQRAALNFCFYSPIAEPPRGTSAFRRFYIKQCFRHGLVVSGKASGNHAFFLRTKKLWMNMNADERAQFDDTDSFASVFPLQPTTSIVKNGRTTSDTNRVSSSSSSATAVISSNSLDDEDEDDVTVGDSYYFEDEPIDDSDDHLESHIVKAHKMTPQKKEVHAVFTV
ncbi:uncharacterized protein TM35_000112220 [Trypanosoma theileri]|uniref:Uncharacterized protein n=1 Tax=Trypanosoma theileri TaxID=67003 RepID=A0A1X0NYQ6_9TRYP|nr:uncharacterized protein TM35_000112220 [Trypanosoma theileri]ORC89688.1 hypothetical protein TM35_000112220 [Trypanosoma theileri]